AVGSRAVHHATASSKAHGQLTQSHGSDDVRDAVAIEIDCSHRADLIRAHGTVRSKGSVAASMEVAPPVASHQYVWDSVVIQVGDRQRLGSTVAAADEVAGTAQLEVWAANPHA